MKKTSRAMIILGISTILTISTVLSSCGSSDIGSVGGVGGVGRVGGVGGASIIGGAGVGGGSTTGSARREAIVTTRTTRNATNQGGNTPADSGLGTAVEVDPMSAFGASTSGSIGYSRCSYSQLDEETGVMGAAESISERDDGVPLISSAAVTDYAGQRLGLIQHSGVLPVDRTVTFALLSSSAREQFITITMQDTEVVAADYGVGDPFDIQAVRTAFDPDNVSAKPDGVLFTIPSDIASAFGESAIALLSSDIITSQCTK